MKILLFLSLLAVVATLSSCTSGSASSATGTPTYTAPSTMEVQSQIEQVHHNRTRVF